MKAQTTERLISSENRLTFVTNILLNKEVGFMKFGYCADIEQADILQQAGYDFIECTVVSLIPEQGDEEFTEILRKFQESNLPVGACNVLLPEDLKITGETVNEERIKRYMEKALYRVKQIGADIVVFGSGAARSFSEEFPREKAKDQIIRFLHIAADYAERLGITIVIEPLNKKESNIINSVPEAVEFAEKVNRKPIQVLADFYHMDEENEPLGNIVSSKKYLKHIHVADTGRFSPGTGNYPYEEFVNQVKQADYNGRISIECSCNDFEKEVKSARKYLEEVFA